MFKQTLLLASSVALLSASTTMCFKKEHIDPSTIETVKLEGGECGGKLTAQDMQRNGYEVGDIKISSGESGLNYIYIFKKDAPLATVTTDGKMILTKEDLKEKLIELQDEQKAEKAEKERFINVAKGKEVYTSQCVKCHGEKAELSAYNVAKPLTTLSFDQMEMAITDYDLGLRKGAYAFLMKPYANTMAVDNLKAVWSYIQTLK
jgi:cytochrome c553